jgi:crossover junction endodeoxyribonuclease RuvC
MTCYIGIDPGAGGGIACLHEDGTAAAVVAPVRRNPKTGRPVPDRQAMTAILRSFDDPFVAIEQVNAAPIHGRVQGTTSMFRFGAGFGLWLGIMEGLGIPYVEVTPRAWKKAVLAGTAKDKQAAIDYCRRLYPAVDLRATPRCRVMHDGKADALCLAVYAKGVHRLREVAR